MGETARVIPFEQRQTPGAIPTFVKAEAVVLTGTDTQSSQRETTVQDLYNEETPSSDVIYRALELLAECELRLESAQQMLSSNDLLGADQTVMLVQSNLPDLFCCRTTLSEGFAATILAIYYAFINRRGEPFSIDQIFTVLRCISALHKSPFLNFEQSLDLVDALVAADLNTDPPEAEQLSQLFAEQSVD